MKQSLENQKKKKKGNERQKKAPEIDDRKNWQFIYICNKHIEAIENSSEDEDNI